MIITPEIMERFYAKREKFMTTEFARQEFDRYEKLFYEIVEGKRLLWVELGFPDHPTEYLPVDTFEEIREITEFHSAPSLEAILADYDPRLFYRPGHTAVGADASGERIHIWVGDYDRYGAECGPIMDVLFPRAEDAPPDAMMQKLIDRYGLDDHGEIGLPPPEQMIEVVIDSGEFEAPRRSVYLTDMIAGQMGLDASEPLYYIDELLGVDADPDALDI